MHPSSGPATHRLELRLNYLPKTESQKSLISRKLRTTPPGDCPTLNSASTSHDVCDQVLGTRLCIDMMPNASVFLAVQPCMVGSR